MPASSYAPAFFGDLFGIVGTRFVPRTTGNIGGGVGGFGGIGGIGGFGVNGFGGIGGFGVTGGFNGVGGGAGGFNGVGGGTGGFTGVGGGTGGGNGSVVRVQSAAKGSGFKIVDSESPQPQTRVYYNFDYYNDVGRAVNVNSGGQVFQGFRHIIGLEKTLFGGDASVGLRLPFVSITGVPGLEDQQFGDMSIVTKYALINEPGRVLSGGLVVTVPTGQGFLIDLPNPQTGIVDGPRPFRLFDVGLQPWIGYILSLTDHLYVQGFDSISVPTESIDVTILSADVGVGYWLYRNMSDRFVQGVIPTLEGHTNIPLDHRGMQSVPIGFSDQFNITAGVYVVLPRSLFGFAVGVPLVGPKPYDYEIAAVYSLRF
jgi:hypothetical protein